MSDRQRRDYGTGSVYQRSDGRWVGAIQAGWTARGTRRRISVTAKSEAAAKRRLRDKIRELEDGAAGSVNTRTTVKQWHDDWLPIAERKLRPTSYASTSSALRIWIVPTIGHKRLDQLGPADVRRVDEAQRIAGRSEGTRIRTHSALMSLLKAARAEGHGVPLRVLEVTAPSIAESDRGDVPLDDAARMLQEAASDPAGSRWVAAFLQGLRQAEALGLTWDALDLERGTLRIEWQLKPLPYRVKRDRSSGFRIPDGYEARQVRDRYHLVRPKTRKGYRVIPLVPWMVASLRRWREVAPDAPHGIVWHHPVGEPAKNDDAAWYALQDAVGVRHPDGRYYTIHEARHTTATLLFEAGVDPAVITAILGHASIVTSRGYQHVNQKALVEAMEKVAARLELGHSSG